MVIYETAMLESGFTFEQPADFAGRLFKLVTKTMGVDADDAAVEEEIDDVHPGDEAPEEPEPDAADAESTRRSRRRTSSERGHVFEHRETTRRTNGSNTRVVVRS